MKISICHICLCHFVLYSKGMSRDNAKRSMVCNISYDFPCNSPLGIIKFHCPHKIPWDKFTHVRIIESHGRISYRLQKEIIGIIDCNM